MELKHRIVSTRFVDSYDLSEYLAKKISRSVDIVGTNNGSEYTADVRIQESFDKYEQEDIDLFINKGILDFEYSGWYNALDYCANQGWLEEGKYVIEVSW